MTVVMPDGTGVWAAAIVASQNSEPAAFPNETMVNSGMGLKDGALRVFRGGGAVLGAKWFKRLE